MRQYEITLPLATNAGLDYRDAHDRFAMHLLNAAGGFTKGPQSMGVWRDDATGTVYKDNVVTYRIALERAEAWPNIVEEAGKLFDDQLAIFTAELGPAWIIDNPHHAHKEAA